MKKLRDSISAILMAGGETLLDDRGVSIEAVNHLVSLIMNEVHFKTPVLQEWVASLSYMQQTVLLTAVRGPDGLTKNCPAKPLLRAYRRVILLSSMDGRVLEDPSEPGGGSFMAPCVHPDGLQGVMKDYIRGIDEYPHHFHMHVVHSVQIIGYKHPDAAVRHLWGGFYKALCQDAHMNPESEKQMDYRLGDSLKQWLDTQQTPLGEIVQ